MHAPDKFKLFAYSASAGRGGGISKLFSSMKRRGRSLNLHFNRTFGGGQTECITFSNFNVCKKLIFREYNIYWFNKYRLKSGSIKPLLYTFSTKLQGIETYCSCKF